MFIKESLWKVVVKIRVEDFWGISGIVRVDNGR